MNKGYEQLILEHTLYRLLRKVYNNVATIATFRITSESYRINDLFARNRQYTCILTIDASFFFFCDYYYFLCPNVACIISHRSPLDFLRQKLYRSCNDISKKDHDYTYLCGARKQILLNRRFSVPSINRLFILSPIFSERHRIALLSAYSARFSIALALYKGAASVNADQLYIVIGDSHGIIFRPFPVSRLGINDAG